MDFTMLNRFYAERRRGFAFVPVVAGKSLAMMRAPGENLVETMGAKEVC
jgi:hypothetical protein